MSQIQYRIEGQHTLRGTVQIGGSKNAALPLLAAAIACEGVTSLTNVPRLRDIETMIKILKFLDVQVTTENSTVTIDTRSIKNKSIPHELVSKLRGCIVLLGPLLARFGEVEMSYPGGCVLGKRPIDAHREVLKQMGANDQSTTEILCLKGKPMKGKTVLADFSVTTTENAIIAAAMTEGETVIELAAAEPHVQAVCHFFVERGVQITGIGSHQLFIQGKREITSRSTHAVIPDYLEAGVFLLAGALTKGEVTIQGANANDLVSFIAALKKVGVRCETDTHGAITVYGKDSALQSASIQTNIFPGFPTDLQAPFGVLFTQAQGVSRIFEVLFEGRMAYLYELEKMGARVEILNAHQALIIGASPLQGRQVASNDIRAGAAMVLAGLCAKGETIVTDVQYIERGYENLPEKLRSLGAKIIREEV